MRALLLALMPTAALAFDPAAMTDAERAAFNDAVRAYLVENPEVLVEVMDALEARQAEAEAEADAQAVAANMDAILDDGHSWVGGNPDGDLTVVEFMDYRCGYCRRAFQEVEDLVSEDGNLRFVLKEFPILGPESEAASRFAIAVQQLHGDDAYKDVHDTLMVMEAAIDEASLSRVAEAFLLDPAPILARMEAPEVTAVIEENRALAQALAISGTPTFVLGDRMVRGYVPLEGMQALVELERGEG